MVDPKTLAAHVGGGNAEKKSEILQNPSAALKSNEAKSVLQNALNKKVGCVWVGNY